MGKEKKTELKNQAWKHRWDEGQPGSRRLDSKVERGRDRVKARILGLLSRSEVHIKE